MATKKEIDIVLKVKNWRTVIDEIAAFHFAKVFSKTDEYKMTIVLKGSGFKIEETMTKAEMIEFGEAYVKRVNLKYGTTYKAFENEAGVSKDSNSK